MKKERKKKKKKGSSFFFVPRVRFGRPVGTITIRLTRSDIDQYTMKARKKKGKERRAPFT